MGDEALFEKTIKTLNKVGEIIHLLLIYIKNTSHVFNCTERKNTEKYVDNFSPPYETIMDYSTTLKTNTLTQKDAVYFQTGGVKGCIHFIKLTI